MRGDADIIAVASSASRLLATDIASAPEADRPCACCGFQQAPTSIGDLPLCLTCAPAFALDMPGIDQVARLIWLPHIDQGMLSQLVRALHVARLSDGQRDRANGLAALAARSAEAEQRLGTCLISEFRHAVRDGGDTSRVAESVLPGIRVLALGRWFDPDADLYDVHLQRWAVL